MKRFYRMTFLRKMLVWLVCCLFFTGELYAAIDTEPYLLTEKETTLVHQQSRITVKGTIVDADGEPIIGANVVEKGTTNGQVTDFDGQFTLEIASEGTLQVSYVGFRPQEVVVNGRSIIQITLQEDAALLDEVVVVGYGVQKKVNLTGSVSTISAASIEARPVTNVSTALAGLAAGVRVYQTSSRPGDDSANIRLRGQGTLNNDNAGALVIIDGIEGILDAVNPNDIEDISILKDAASASIYGARAANGVILVTTKSGKKGKPRVNFNGIISLAQVIRAPEFLSDHATYMELFNESRNNLGQASTYSQASIDAWREAAKNPNALNEYGYPNYVVYPNTDWGDVFFSNSWIQNYSLSVTGGSDNTSYLFSGSYLKNPGILDNTGAERFQVRANIKSTVANVLTFGTNTFMSLTKNQMRGTASSNFNYLRQTMPGVYPYKYDGYWGMASYDPNVTAGGISSAWYETGGNDEDARVNTTLFGQLDIIKGLTFETKVNYQTRIRERNNYPISQVRKDFSTDLIYEQSLPSPADMRTSYSFKKNYQLTYDNVLRYMFDINKDHNFFALVGHNEYYYNYYETAGSRLGLLDEGIYVPNSAGEEDTRFTGTENDRSMRSFFGRLNYDYKSKYLFEFNIRYDGSSRFGTERRWGTFPSVSGGWRITEEKFAEPLKAWFQNLKLRASWGKLGNDAAGNYDYQANYAIAQYSFNDKAVTGLGQTKLANQYLQWEATQETDLALEATFLNSRANVEINYYDKLTKGILTTPPIFLTAGEVKAPTVNGADLTNRGIEISLGWNDRIQDFRYSVKGNFAYNYNTVKKYKGEFKVNSEGVHNLGEVSDTSGEGYIVEGHGIGEFFMRKVYKGNGSYFNSDGSVNINGGPKDGMIRTEDDMRWVMAMKEAEYQFAPVNTVGASQLYYGDLIYADLNGDGIYGDTNDQAWLGKSALPKYNYGFSIDMEWKNFDLSMIWAGSAGMHYYFLSTGYNTSYTEDSNAIGKDVAANRYYYNVDDPGDPRNNINGTYPRLTYRTNPINGIKSDRWVYNASYLKLKNIQVGYTIPAQYTRKLHIADLRVYVSGENLLMFTPYPFMDPEQGSGIGYLPMRQFAFGLNVNF